MNRSSLRAAAISWMIACGLFCGGAATFGVAPVAAEPGTAHNESGGAGSDGAAAGNGQGPHGSDGRTTPDRGANSGVSGTTSTGTPSTDLDGMVTAGAAGGTGYVRGNHEQPQQSDPQTPTGPKRPANVGSKDSNWPWPWPPCDGESDDTGGSVGKPAPRGFASPDRFRNARPPQNATGGNRGITSPPVKSPLVPGLPTEPSPVNADGDQDPVAESGEPATLEMPPVIGLPPLFEVPLRPVGSPGGSSPVQSGPGGRVNPATEPNPVREPPPTRVGAGTEAPASSRVGYPQYLRDARVGEVAVLALPGFAGLLALTAVGGFLGYRQARAGHRVRAAGTARFLG